MQGYTNHEAVEVLRNTGKIVRLCLIRYLRGPKYDQLQQAIGKFFFFIYSFSNQFLSFDTGFINVWYILSAASNDLTPPAGMPTPSVQELVDSTANNVLEVNNQTIEVNLEELESQIDDQYGGY